jgi:Sporulation factor SpoIIGA
MAHILISPSFILPNFPGNTPWLTEEEKQFAEWRLVDDAKEADDKDSISILGALRLAFKDYRLYLFILLQHTSILSQTFQYFFPSIVKTLGYGRIATLLLTVPVWFTTFLVSLFVTWTAGRSGDRSIHIMSLMAISCLGNIIATATTRLGPRFFAMFLMPIGAVASYQIIVSWVANSFIRPLVKRSACISICNMIGNCATIYGSYMYPGSAAPQYIPGGSANAAVCFLVICWALVLRLVHIRENKKLEKTETEDVVIGDHDEEKRAKGFRYVI